MDDELISLDDLLSDEPETEALAPEPVAEPEPVEPETPRDEHGRFAPKTGVDEPVPPTAGLPKDEYKAIREEREKRQRLEQELEALRQQFQAAQNPPAPPPSIWEDDAGALQHVQQQAVSQAVQQATFNARLDMSEMMVRQAQPDFEEVKAEFLALAQDNPQLRQQALADPHPWQKAYQIAKNARTMRDLGATDVDTLRAKLREEIMAEMQAQPAPRPGFPTSLSTARNVGSRNGPAWSGPPSLDELLA